MIKLLLTYLEGVIFFQLGAGFSGKNFTLPGAMIPMPEKNAVDPALHLDVALVGPDEGLPLVWAPQFQTRKLTIEEIQPGTSRCVWCSDITYIWTREGFVYLTSIMDLYSRKIIVWVVCFNYLSREKN